MLKDIAKKYYLEKSYNCAESIFLASNEYYNLGLNEKIREVVTAFGGGMGCGRTCGALTGALAILGVMVHMEKEPFHQVCTKLIEDYEKELETSVCDELKIRYKTEKERCWKTVEIASDVFEKFIEEVAPKYKK
ncbi:MAG: C-GCAxxG-C-C family protein [Fusobacterium perfoetens]|uniref:C-GCAxxG-C-C family (seleno)protein n=1 Tax=Fusobacterium perfoetens TaxID=852 RepID=UPI0023F2A46F|nr:C-GCAxxG-C-C family (seleno)protein [Fusobacterium perfoetens]MCI6152518.1 C-GCAxxG-C-C family protein [Fusobacterium perfoetens]MDY3237526.1 C-GCAxxG-C-C family (seleno)protein [Fusobacterium perfoetens]